MDVDKPIDELWPLDFICLITDNAPLPDIYEMRLEKFQSDRSNPKLDRGVKLEDLARLVMLGSHYFTPIETHTIYFYHPDWGIWIPKGKDMIETLCRYIWPGLSPQAINDIIGKIRNYSLGPGEWFNKQRVVAIKNGVIDLTTWELKPHSPDYYLTKALPVVYDPEADCPNIRTFLSQVTNPENVQILEEAIGYCLEPDYQYLSAFLLFGPTKTGKSTFLKILKSFLGSKNVSNLTLQQIGERQFGVNKLKEKYANIAPDMPTKTIYNTGVFKALTGGDTINADVKYKESIEFSNTAKLFFSANMIPPSAYDDTDAYYGRWIIIDFPHQFLDKADSRLIEKLTTSKELSGLLNIAITALKRLRIRDRFEETIDLESKKTAYLIGSDTVKAFIHLKCKIEVSAWVMRKSLHDDYSDFCTTQGRTPIKYEIFTKTLRKWVPNVESKIRVIGGQRRKIYVGIDVKESILPRETLWK